MSNLSDFFPGGGAPKLMTTLTSGSGTYIPTVNNARCFVMVQGGGGGGGSGANFAGGNGGAMVYGWYVIPIAGYTWLVGGQSAAASAGNKSYFHTLIAQAGGLPNPTSGGQYAGWPGAINSGLSGDIPYGSNGVSGGVGVYSGFGQSINRPMLGTANTMPGRGTNPGSGGDSYFGIGGNQATGTGLVGGIGAGGGMGSVTGGAGGAGIIYVFDYGV